MSKPESVVVIGAGPAGLTAAYELGKAGRPGDGARGRRDGRRHQPHGGPRGLALRHRRAPLLHQGARGRGAVARDPPRRGLHDATAHEPDPLPRQALRLPAQGGERAAQPRAARGRSGACCPTLLGAGAARRRTRRNFEGWVAARFGWRLYRIFFKTYTEKLWGRDATELQSDWAAQRIKNLSLFNAVRQRAAAQAQPEGHHLAHRGVPVPAARPGDDVGALRRAGRAGRAARSCWRPRSRRSTASRAAARSPSPPSSPAATAPGPARPRRRAHRPRQHERYACDHVVSTMPLSSLVLAMDPPAPAHVQAAARDLKYRDYLTVALVVPEDAGFPDNWIYIHEPEVLVGRIQNYGSWSPHLVKDGRTCLGLEYFVFAGRRHLVAARRRARRARDQGARAARPRAARPDRARLRRPDAEGVSVLRQGLPRQHRHHPHLDRRGGAERAPGRAQRHAPLQQPGPLHADGDPQRPEHRRGHAPRRLAGQRRGRLPRGADGPPRRSGLSATPSDAA